MRKFTKFSKIPFSILREKGFLSVFFVDDSYLQGVDSEDCFSNVLNTTEILRSLGFTIHPDKFKFIPMKFRIDFKLCQNDNYFNSGEKRKRIKPLPRNA